MKASPEDDNTVPRAEASSFLSNEKPKKELKSTKNKKRKWKQKTRTKTKCKLKKSKEKSIVKKQTAKNVAIIAKMFLFKGK